MCVNKRKKDVTTWTKEVEVGLPVYRFTASKNKCAAWFEVSKAFKVAKAASFVRSVECAASFKI